MMLKYQNWVIHSVIVVWLLHIEVHTPSLGHSLKAGGTNNVTCVDTDRRGLLELKRGFENVNDNSLLSEWNAENMNCCRWLGIKCSKDGRVIALDLSHNELEGEIGPSLLDLPYLEFIDLSGNLFSGKIPSFICSLKSLRYLDLSHNELEGEIPDFFSTNLSSLLTLNASWNWLTNSSGFLQLGSTSLQELHLDYNKLTGLLPDLSKFPSLRVLNLAENEFKDNLERFIQDGSRLVELDVSSNSCNGVLREDNFQYHSELQVLILSYNSVQLKFNPWWTPPFQLTVLKLRNCKLGPEFPLWVRAQSNLTELDISNSGVSAAIPSWFWNVSSQFQYLNISHNRINHNLSGLLPAFTTGISVVDLSFNQLYGALPSFSSDVGVLDLSNNKFSGDISFFCSLNVGSLVYLNLRNNQLSGSLDTCWERVDGLQLLNLNNNNFSGYLPQSMGNLRSIMSLSLRNNSLSGELPSSLIKCQYLKLLDLGDNKLSGVIPSWIGTTLQKLRFLALHANRLTGSIPRALCHLDSIQILDLSFNNISGMIPPCLNNFTAMVSTTRPPLYASPDNYASIYIHYESGVDSIYTESYYATWVQWKGKNREFENEIHLKLLTLIDLSNNNLSGPIPPELASLDKLISLNLANNSLTGIIPDNIGQLKKLDSLDLSRNLLSGEIPRSMADLSSLGYLDLSSNNLSGKIPSSTQLQSFNASAFNNNLMLCGPPTTNPCPGDKSVEDTPTNAPNLDQKSEAGIFDEDKWLYMSIGVGIIVGFWGFCGTFILKVSWRQRYFEILNNWMEGLYVIILVSISKLSRKVTS